MECVLLVVPRRVVVVIVAGPAELIPRRLSV